MCIVDVKMLLQDPDIFLFFRLLQNKCGKRELRLLIFNIYNDLCGKSRCVFVLSGSNVLTHVECVQCAWFKSINLTCRFNRDLIA